MKTWVIVAAAFVSTVLGVPAYAGPTLDAVRTRGELVCGLRGDTMGFARVPANGQAAGFEVDLCRAVAIAILGPQARVKFVPLPAERRLGAVRAGEVDLLVSGTTVTFGRETTDGVDFPTVYYFDTQGIMVPRKLNKSRASDLAGVAICVTSGTTTERTLASVMSRLNVKYTAVPARTVEELRSNFFGGKCGAMTADTSALYSTRAAYAANPEEFVVLRDQLAQEPLGIGVRSGDREFSNVARWVVFALLHAEENRIGMRNAADLRANGTDQVKRFLGGIPGIGKGLGLDDSWAFNVIGTVGNYGEMFDRNLGPTTPLKVFRGLNVLWSQGGMHYSPAFN